MYLLRRFFVFGLVIAVVPGICAGMAAAAAADVCQWTPERYPKTFSAEIGLSIQSGMDITARPEVSTGQVIVAATDVFLWVVRKDEDVFYYHGDGGNLRYVALTRGVSDAGAGAKVIPLKDTWLSAFSSLLFKGALGGIVASHQKHEDGCVTRWDGARAEDGASSREISPFAFVEMRWTAGRLPRIHRLVFKEHLGTLYELDFADVKWEIPYKLNQMKQAGFVDGIVMGTKARVP